MSCFTNCPLHGPHADGWVGDGEVRSSHILAFLKFRGASFCSHSYQLYYDSYCWNPVLTTSESEKLLTRS